MERFGDQVSVVTGLLETGDKLNGGSERRKPSDEFLDAPAGVIEALGMSIVRAKEVAEEVRLSDVNSKEERGSGSWNGSSFHGFVLSFRGTQNNSRRDGHSLTSKQIQWI